MAYSWELGGGRGWKGSNVALASAGGALELATPPKTTGGLIPTPGATARAIGSGAYHGLRGVMHGVSGLRKVAPHAADLVVGGARSWWQLGRGIQSLAAGARPAGHPGFAIGYIPPTGVSAAGTVIGTAQPFEKAYPKGWGAPGSTWEKAGQRHNVAQAFKASGAIHTGHRDALKFNAWGMGTKGRAGHGIGAFYKRGAMGHMARIGTNIGYTSKFMLNPFARAGGFPAGLLMAGFLHGGAMAGSSDNIFSAQDGYARGLARGLGEFLGADVGMGVGAALGTALAPVLGVGVLAAPVIGLVAGAIGGAIAASQIADLPWTIASLGRTYAKPFKSQFMDSQRAVTMRQKSMQMIQRSHLNARSALSQEALAYHM